MKLTVFITSNNVLSVLPDIIKKQHNGAITETTDLALVNYRQKHKETQWKILAEHKLRTTIEA